MRGALPPTVNGIYEMGGCPACGSDEATEIASAAAVRDEVEAVWVFHTRRLRPETPPRQLSDRTVFSQHPPLRLVQCDRCGTVYRNPREHERALEEIYRGESVSPEVMAGLFEAQRDTYMAQARRLTRLAHGPGRGLEVGSYVGGFLAAARQYNWRFRGIDVNDCAIAFARRRGLDVVAGTLESFDAADSSFDAVAFWNCFDQLPRPRAAAIAAARLLRRGGLLAVRVPNGTFYARIRSLLAGPAAPLARALLAYNNLLGFPYRTGFNPASLAGLLRTAGLHVIAVRGDTLVPLADGWTRPWAAMEERLLKRTIRALGSDRSSPWFELYARA